jgi:hypothetical protein
MSNRRTSAPCWLSLCLLIGCSAAPSSSGDPAPIGGTTTARAQTGVKPSGGGPSGRGFQSLPAGQIRMAIVVRPGDALVEVDDRPAQRRDGAIDLAGAEGKTVRVRVSLGKKERVWDVTLHEKAPPPDPLDLNERAPPPVVVARPVPLRVPD